MTILVLGVNHKTATVALREKVAFSEEKRLSALRQIDGNALAQSVVILSTCNRTEIYLHNKNIPPQDTEDWLSECSRWFAQIHGLPLHELQDYLYLYQNQQAVQHIMRVACGLDSLILGEPQILGQVKQAYQISENYYQQSQRSISSELSRLFQKTFAAAKRVRTETNIGENAVSVAYAACSLARQIFDNLRSLNILLVGAGETIELTGRHLLRHGVKHLMIANRTLSRAETLVERLESDSNIRLLPLQQLQEGLNQADIVITSTASQTVLITQAMVKIAQQQRHYNPLLIIDIAVPRDVEESVSELDAVYHYTVDDLHNIIRRNLSEREKASQQAEQVIRQEADDFFQWLKVHQFSGLIRAYRDNAEQSRQELLEKAFAALLQGQDAQQVVQELSYKLTNKLLHPATQAMQTMVKNGNVNGLSTFSAILKAPENEN